MHPTCTALFLLMSLVIARAQDAATAYHFDTLYGFNQFKSPRALATYAQNLYIVDYYNFTVRVITPQNHSQPFVGMVDGPGYKDGNETNAQFQSMEGIAFDRAGNLYIADTGNQVVRKANPNGVVVTLAGAAGQAGNVDGAGTDARFGLPAGIAVDASGNVYVGDISTHTIRKISPAGIATTLAGLAGMPGSADGTGNTAQFNLPAGLAVDASGNILVADSGNHAIRKITPAGVVTTYAGALGIPGSNDGPAATARFNGPTGLTLSPTGAIFVADTLNHTIRRISQAGEVITIAGAPRNPGYAAGTGFAARFDHPVAVAVGSDGRLYVTDTTTSAIRVGTANQASRIFPWPPSKARPLPCACGPTTTTTMQSLIASSKPPTAPRRSMATC